MGEHNVEQQVDETKAQAFMKALLEDLRALASMHRAPHQPYQFLGLAGKHAAANNFDPTKIDALMVQLLAHKGQKDGNYNYNDCEWQKLLDGPRSQ